MIISGLKPQYLQSKFNFSAERTKPKGREGFQVIRLNCDDNRRTVYQGLGKPFVGKHANVKSADSLGIKGFWVEITRPADHKIQGSQPQKLDFQCYLSPELIKNDRMRKRRQCIIHRDDGVKPTIAEAAFLRCVFWAAVDEPPLPK